MRTVLLAAAVLAAVPALAAAQAPPRVTLQLDDVPVTELVHALAAQLHEPVVVSTDAQDVARCAHVSVSTGGAQPVPRVIAAVNDALLPAGLDVVRNASGVVVEHIAGAPPPPSCVGPHVAPPSGVAPGVDEIVRGIHTRPDGTIAITPAARDAIFANQEVLMRSARVIPQLENNVVVGIRLFGIRRGSVLALLGLENGDTLRELNGYPLASPEHALEAYSRVHGAENVQLAITRNGQPRILQYVLDH